MDPNVPSISTQAFTENVIVTHAPQNFKSFWVPERDYYISFLTIMEKQLIWQTKTLHALGDNTDLFAAEV